MKNKRFPILFIFILLAGLFFLLKQEVITRQGVDFKVREIRLPLYLKMLNFLDRHYNYKDLAKKITKNSTGQKEKVMSIFDWTYGNIRRQPKELPVIDDHIWSIIVRGYGLDEQFNEVFATLCNYAGVKAYYSFVSSDDGKSSIPLSFVEIKGAWFVFDPYNGNFLKNVAGNLLSIDQLKLKKDGHLGSRGNGRNFDYSLYINDLPLHPAPKKNRASLQFPPDRLFYQINRLINQQEK